jgi:hypothetical protein
LAKRIVDPGNRDFGNSVAKFAREPKNFHIESKSINPLTEKHLLGYLAAKTLESALRVPDTGKDQPLDKPIESSPH